LFLLLFIEPTPLSLSSWVARLKQDRVLAALIGCPLHFPPPLGSYFDFMNRLWATPSTDLYSRRKLLPASWNRKKPGKPKGKGQKAAKAKPQITKTISDHILHGKDIPFNFEALLQKFFYLVAVIPSLECSLISPNNLTVSGDGTAVHIMPIQKATAVNPLLIPVLPMMFRTLHQDIFLTRMLPRDRTAALTSTIMAIHCSNSPAITVLSIPISLCFSVSPAPNNIILSMPWSHFTNWRNIYLPFP